MSDRPLIVPIKEKPIVNAGDMSGTVTSPVTILKGASCISYDLRWTGTPTGAFSVQVSNSWFAGPNGQELDSGFSTWNDLPTGSFSGTYPVPAGSNGNGMLDVVLTGSYAIRLVYVPDSGSGVLTVYAAAKVS